MPMAFVTTWMTVLESLTLVGCATVQVRSSPADARAFPEGDCDCDGNQLDACGHLRTVGIW